MTLRDLLLRLLRRRTEQQTTSNRLALLAQGYFAPGTWHERLVARLEQVRSTDAFMDQNSRAVETLVSDRASGLRMVINITAEALLNFLKTGDYKNLYEKPVIGGVERQPSPDRRRVDNWLGLGDSAGSHYFGAIALGGTGVRFYGEYCMVIRSAATPPETKLFDRDSYDLLLPPLSTNPEELASTLKGQWGRDLHAMVMLKIFPALTGNHRLATTGTISDEVLRDEEFIEVHKRGKIALADIHEIRISPDEYAAEFHRALTESQGGLPSAVHILWSKQRQDVLQSAKKAKVALRVVTGDGRGYQWK